MNLVNSKALGPEVLFRSIESSKYREIDIKLYNTDWVTINDREPKGTFTEMCETLLKVYQYNWNLAHAEKISLNILCKNFIH